MPMPHDKNPKPSRMANKGKNTLLSVILKVKLRIISNKKKSQNSKTNLCEEELREKNNDHSVIDDSDEVGTMPSPGNARKLERDIQQKSEDLEKCRLLNLKLQERLIKAEEERDQLKKQNEKLEKEFKKSEQEANHFQLKNIKLHQDNESLENRLQIATAKSSFSQIDLSCSPIEEKPCE